MREALIEAIRKEFVEGWDSRLPSRQIAANALDAALALLRTPTNEIAAAVARASYDDNWRVDHAVEDTNAAAVLETLADALSVPSAIEIEGVSE